MAKRITDYMENEILFRVIIGRKDDKARPIPVQFVRIDETGQPVVRMQDKREKPVLWRTLFKFEQDALAFSDYLNHATNSD